MTKDMPIRIHLVGDWAESQVRTAWGESAHVVPAEARELIDRAWTVASARPGVKLFNGPMCRLESWSGTSDGTLQLTLSRTSYKLFLGTNMCHPELADRYGSQVLANPVGVSQALETADGFLMLGRRNAHVAYYPSRVHPFAGCLEPAEGSVAGAAPGINGPDVFAAVRRELSEELGLGAADVATIRCTGIAEDVCLRQPELMFHVKSTLTRSRIESQVARDEHHEGWSVPATRSGVEAGITDPELTPVAVASLLLWGRIALGTEWFEAMQA